MAFWQEESSITLLLIVEYSKVDYFKVFLNFSHFLIRGLIKGLKKDKRFFGIKKKDLPLIIVDCRKQ